MGKVAKMPILGHIYPWDTKAHIIWHIPGLKDPSPPLDAKSIIHAYGHVYKRQNGRACSQGNIT